MIETNRCKIIKVQKNDYEDIIQLYFDKEVRKFLGEIVTSERFESNFNGMLTSDENSFYWVVRLKDTNEFIGLVSLDKHHDGVSIELSYQFIPRMWGYGYADEVTREIIDYAFDILKLEKIVAETQSANISSCKLLKKLGMCLQQTIQRFGAEQHIFCITNNTD